MFCTTSETEGEVCPVKVIKPPVIHSVDATVKIRIFYVIVENRLVCQKSNMGRESEL